ncbi:tetratricopeptide repeat protein [Mucilaginibacter pallidiroseus]|uniref:histidine kinase n=1 Tax=Mucilaginibacter pallidiroseus TaxID=2599295 RepID=A0A563UJG9_9SPHI|nr:tetratricopeptide repeat protein [Mucilaginibacter pallidiroseus]
MLLLLLAIFVAASNNVSAQTVDSDTVQVKIDQYNKLISQYRYDKPDSALFLAQQGLSYSRKYKSTNGQAMMLNQLGMIDDNVGRFDDSRRKYLSALALYTKTANKKGMAAVNIRLGVVEMRKGNYDKAIEYFLQALQISKANASKPGEMEAYITLGEAYAGQKKYGEALKYYKVAEQLNAEVPFSNLSLNLFNDIGISLRETNRLDKAKPYLHKGISLSNVKQYQGLNITLTNTLASVYAKSGDIATSIKLQKQALEKAKKINNYIRQIQTLTGLATTYSRIDAHVSLDYWQQALALSKSKGAHKEEIDELQAIAQLYKLQQNYKAAFDAKERQYELADEFFYKKMSAQIASLQADYELNQSKAKVEELKFANNKEKLERKITNVFLAGLCVVLLVVVFFYFKTRQLNNLLNKTNAALNESNTVKDKLFSVLGHDLRSPFISIINMLQIIDEPDLTGPERDKILEQLDFTSRASLETLDSLLRWGQKQIKGTPLNKIEFAIEPIVSRTIHFLSGVAEDKAIEIQNNVAEYVAVVADIDHFEFMIRNLLSNAIKYSEYGGNVTVTSNYNRALKQVVISVADKGIGIEPARLNNIFNIDNISTRGTGNEKGTSLGLLLCKEFAELNGGSISVESAPGEGSIFSITLNAGSIS